MYLYDHPKDRHSTASLLSALKDEPGDLLGIAETLRAVILGAEGKLVSAPKKERAIADMQAGVEQLIVKRLIRGKRDGTPGNITHNAIQLTQQGEREAITLKEHSRNLSAAIEQADQRAKQFEQERHK